MIRILVGPPAAGKSTYLTEHAAPGDIRVDFDALALALGAETSHDSGKDVKDVTHAARNAAIAEILTGKDTDAWIIHTSPTEEQLEEYKTAGAEVVTIDPGMEVALEQAAADERPEWTEQAIRDWYEQRKSTSPPVEKSTTTRKEAAPMAVTRKTMAAKVTLPAPEAEEEDGTFEAIVSVFGNKDLDGDIVEPGAFTKPLARWIVKGTPVPVMWAHTHQDSEAILGEFLVLEERPEGLYVKGRLDLDHPPAARIYNLMKRGLVTEFSWSGEILEAEWLEDDDDLWWPGMRIKEIDLWEAGPCFKGANPETELLSVKTDGRLAGKLLAGKSGRVLSQRNLEALKSARDKLTEVIESAETEPAEEPESGDESKTAKTATPTDPAPYVAPPNVRALLELLPIQ